MNKKNTYYGEFGGQYVSESLMNTLGELDEAFEAAIKDPEFIKQYNYYLKQYVGRETPLYYAERLSKKYGTKIYLKREDLNHTGAHKINNVIGQILLAKRMRKKKVIAETGAGQHGVATATGAALFDMECTVYMGKEDIERLITFQQKYPVPFVFAYGNEMFVTEVNDRVQAVSDLIEIPVPPVASIEEARGKDILQIMGYFTAEEEKETDIFGKVLTHCEPMRWYPLFADIIARGNSKSTGIDKVLEYFGINLKDTMAFGDGGNDIPMLKHVATGIAMGNAEPHVKAVADYVTTSVDEDGIANALKHFGLI